MRQYIAFTKKEFLEALRTHKLLILIAVFLIIGFMNPLFAKLTPIILEATLPDMDLGLSDPTAYDSWAQFYSNVIQIGLITLVIVFSGLISNEYNRDTLINVLTKGLDRKTVVLSKFTMATLVWTVSYILCFIVTWLYTVILWPNDSPNNLIQAAFYLWLFGILLISLIILGNSLFKGALGTLLFIGGTVTIAFIINIIPIIEKFNPTMLMSNNYQLILGSVSNGDFLWPSILTVFTIISSLLLAIRIFNKREI